jgi:Flp pilus assembly protein TadG
MKSQIQEEGVVTAFVVGLLMTFIVCAGLGVDGGRLVAARLTLADHAENAARFAAQELVSLRTGSPKIDQQAARRSAMQYFADNQLNGEVEVSAESVTITVSQTIEMSLLQLFGARDHLISVTRRVEPRSQ